MTARALLDRLAAAGLSVTAEGGKLQIRPAAKFTDALRADVVAAKPELLALVGAKGGDPEPIKDALAEVRAAPVSAKVSALQRQRARRATRPRIDFYPSAEAVRVIDSLRHGSVGGDASSIINRALVEWGASGIHAAPKRAPGRRSID